jgi:hypothetical protein
MATPFLQGFQAGGAMMGDALDRSLRMQQLQSDAAHRRVMEQNAAQLLSMKMEENNLSIQYRADMAKAVTAAQQATSPHVFFQGPDGPAGMENPNLLTEEQAAMRFVVPVIAQYEPNKVQDALEGIALAKYRKRAAAGGTEPQIKVITGPDGRQHQVFDPGDKGVSQLVTPEPTVTTDEAGNQFYQSGPNRFNRVPESATQRQKEQFKRTQQAEQLKFIRDSNSKAYADLFSNSPVDPETGMPQPTPESIATAAKSAGFEGGTVAKMEEQMVGAENLLTTANQFLPLITKNNVGWRGAVRRWGTRLGLEGMPGFKDSSEAEQAATMSRIFVAEIFRVLRSDSNIAKPEVEALEDAAPDAKKFINDPDSMKSQMATILKNAADKSRNGARRLGREIFPFFLTQEEIEAKGLAGEITKEKAIELYNKSAWKLIDSLEAR